MKFYLLYAGEKFDPVITENGYKVYMKLIIREVEESDFGNYKCIARNSLGDTDGSITIYGKSRPINCRSKFHEQLLNIVTCLFRNSNSSLLIEGSN